MTENNINDNSNEEIFKALAKSYVETEGSLLKAQLEESKELQISKEFDRKVYGSIRNKIRKAYSFYAPAAALLLVIISFGILRSLTPDKQGADNTSEAITDSQAYEAVPLVFTLPDNFSVSKITQDKAETLYYLTDDYNDDVIISAVMNGSGFNTLGLTEIQINGLSVYASARADFSIFIFMKEDIIYTLTCRIDYHTLVNICEKIL